MASLRELVSQTPPLLILDAASTRIQAGLLLADGSQRWAAANEEAGSGLFHCLESLQVKIPEIAGFVYCEGPGSILGIRTVASALRAWLVLKPRPCWAYRSLELAARSQSNPELCFISDARRDSWHAFQLGRGQQRVPSANLPAAETLRTPEGFRQWSKLPPGLSVASCSYDLQTLIPALLDEDFLHASPEPDAFLHEEPSYVTWTPEIHRAPKA